MCDKFKDVEKAKTLSEFKRVVKLRQSIYEKHYPRVSFDRYDEFDYCSSIWLSRESNDEVVSTSRLVFDSDCGLPSEKYIASYILPLRESDLKLAEFGRLVNSPKSRSTLVSSHFAAAYLDALEQSVDLILLVTSANKKSFYCERIGADMLCEDIGTGFGGQEMFALYSWSLKKTAKGFFSWTGIQDPNAQDPSIYCQKGA